LRDVIDEVEYCGTRPRWAPPHSRGCSAPDAARPQSVAPQGPPNDWPVR
jgi:hypothetical protein